MRDLFLRTAITGAARKIRASSGSEPARRKIFRRATARLSTTSRVVDHQRKTRTDTHETTRETHRLVSQPKAAGIINAARCQRPRLEASSSRWKSVDRFLFL